MEWPESPAAVYAAGKRLRIANQFERSTEVLSQEQRSLLSSWLHILTGTCASPHRCRKLCSQTSESHCIWKSTSLPRWSIVQLVAAKQKDMDTQAGASQVPTEQRKIQWHHCDWSHQSVSRQASILAGEGNHRRRFLRVSTKTKKALFNIIY